MSDNKILGLAKLVKPVRSDATLNAVCKLLSSGNYDHSLTLPIIDDADRVIGTINRYRILNIFVNPYGKALFGRHAVVDFMDTNPIVLESDLPVMEASRALLDKLSYPIKDDYVITHNGTYFGMGIIMDLLRKISDVNLNGGDRFPKAQFEVFSTRLRNTSAATDNALQVQNLYFAKIIHELRTPLNAILGYADLMKNDCMEHGDEHYIEDLSHIKTAGSHLLSIINTLLDLAKVEAGRMDVDRHEFIMRDLVSDISYIAKPLFERNQSRLLVEIDSPSQEVYTDHQKLRQILLNLLSNAAKYSNRQPVSLKISSFSRHGAPWIQFAVVDRGIGIRDDLKENLFNPFVQGDKLSRFDYGGTGLGLAIAKQFCQLLGGDISVESTAGIGTSFYVRIPVQVPAQHTGSDETEKPFENIA